jgi:hypothetical protein
LKRYISREKDKRISAPKATPILKATPTPSFINESTIFEAMLVNTLLKLAGDRRPRDSTPVIPAAVGEPTGDGSSSANTSASMSKSPGGPELVASGTTSVAVRVEAYAASIESQLDSFLLYREDAIFMDSSLSGSESELDSAVREGKIPPSTTDDEDSSYKYSVLTVREFKEELKPRGLTTSRNKADLLTRLKKVDEETS